MEWCKLFASLPDDPRVQLAEHDAPGAAWLLVQSMCYLTRAESKGFIPHTQVPKFGMPKRCTEALLARECWHEVRDGFAVNGDLWSEERNLTDTRPSRDTERADAKRQADRERVAAQRAAAREAAELAGQNGHSANGVARQSHDRSAIVGATDRATSRKRRATRRADPKSREEPPPIAPPATPTAVPDGPPAGEGGDFTQQRERPNAAEVEALVTEIRQARQDWDQESIRASLLDPRTLDRPWPLVCAAALIRADDTRSKYPSGLSRNGYWWTDARAALGQGGAVQSSQNVTCPVHQLSHAASAECRGCAGDRKAAAEVA